MKLLKNIPYLVIAGLLAYIFILSECTRKPKCPETKADSTSVTIVTPLPVDTTKHYYPAPYKIIVHDTVPGKVDSVAIRAKCFDTYKDWNALKKYDLPMFGDSLGPVNLLAEVQNNKLKSWQMTGKLRRYETVKTYHDVIVQPVRNKIAAGAILSADLNSLSVLPTATLITKRNNIYQVSVDPFQKPVRVQVGLFKVISFRKNP